MFTSRKQMTNNFYLPYQPFKEDLSKTASRHFRSYHADMLAMNNYTKKCLISLFQCILSILLFQLITTAKVSIYFIFNTEWCFHTLVFHTTMKKH